MRLTRYRPIKHEKFLEKMIFDRDLPKYTLDELPCVGYLYLEEGRPVAAGFLRMCEGDVAMFDSFITSPGESPELRDKALDIITKKLVHTSKKLGISRLLAFSVDQNTIIRALRHGFVATPHVVVARK